MASTYQITESAIFDAITALNEGFYSTPTAAAKAYNVAPRTVQRRLQGMGSRSSRTPPKRALNPEHEQAIRNYLKRLDNAVLQEETEAASYRSKECALCRRFQFHGIVRRRAEIAAEKKEKAEDNARKRTKEALFKEVKAYLKARPQLAKSLT